MSIIWFIQENDKTQSRSEPLSERVANAERCGTLAVKAINTDKFRKVFVSEKVGGFAQAQFQRLQQSPRKKRQKGCIWLCLRHTIASGMFFRDTFDKCTWEQNNQMWVDWSQIIVETHQGQSQMCSPGGIFCCAYLPLSLLVTRPSRARKPLFTGVQVLCCCWICRCCLRVVEVCRLMAGCRCQVLFTRKERNANICLKMRWKTRRQQWFLVQDVKTTGRSVIRQPFWKRGMYRSSSPGWQWSVFIRATGFRDGTAFWSQKLLHQNEFLRPRVLLHHFVLSFCHFTPTLAEQLRVCMLSTQSLFATVVSMKCFPRHHQLWLGEIGTSFWCLCPGQIMSSCYAFVCQENCAWMLRDVHPCWSSQLSVNRNLSVTYFSVQNCEDFAGDLLSEQNLMLLFVVFVNVCEPTCACQPRQEIIFARNKSTQTNPLLHIVVVLPGGAGVAKQGLRWCRKKV